jgi:predicted transcriptional regulator
MRRRGAEVSSSVQRLILANRSHSVKKRVKGKTCYYFKLIESQEELDALMAQDLEDWKKFMKDNGAWEE